MSRVKNYNQFHLVPSRGFFIPQDCSLVEMAKILQGSTDYVVSLMNDSVIHFFSESKIEPLELLSYNHDQTEYCFVDKKGNTYLIFGKQRAAKFFVPRDRNVKQITLVDKGKSYLFSYVPPEIKVRNYEC